MSTQLINSHRENAEIYHGRALCKQKSRELLEHYSFPKGLLPLDIIELGINRSTGFLWLKQEKKTEHKFKAINKKVSYDTEVAAFIEKGRLSKITGVKAKEFLLAIPISDISIKDPSSGKIEFGVAGVVGDSFPISAFELQEEEGHEQKNRN